MVQTQIKKVFIVWLIRMYSFNCFEIWRNTNRTNIYFQQK